MKILLVISYGKNKLRLTGEGFNDGFVKPFVKKKKKMQI